VPRADAEVAADVLLAADLRGIDTHGGSRLKYYADRLTSGITKPAAPFEVLRETSTTAVVDAHVALGHPVAARAMRMAMDKASAHGLGAVAVRGSTHFGIAGYYVDMAARAGLVGFAATNARPAMAPTFSSQPMLGTNPLAFAAPSDEEDPFVFDAALSIVQRGNIEVAAREGEPLPEGWAVDGEGRAVTDPVQLLRQLSADTAALLPLGGPGENQGGHKGYGLAVMVEILCAALQGGDFLTALAGGLESGRAQGYRLGHFFLAMNVEAFVPLAECRAAVGRIQRALRKARKMPGCDRIWTAGEKEWDCQRERRRLGVPVPAALREEWLKLRTDLGLGDADCPL
jgi:LDH2 family malate/lactate/ureidoglycolate dehydrogenase